MFMKARKMNIPQVPDTYFDRLKDLAKARRLTKGTMYFKALEAGLFHYEKEQRKIESND